MNQVLIPKTKIGAISFITCLSLNGYDLVHGLIDKIRNENIKLTKARFIPGIEHQIKVGDYTYHIRVYYSKDGNSIDKIAVKQYGGTS